MDASYFKGKKITLMGLGLLGRGVGDARFLVEAGADLIVTDLKSSEQLAPSLEALKDLSITYVLGEHRLEDFRDRDLVLVAPKTPLDSPYVAEARKNGIPVSMSTALFAKLAGVNVVGVTGTRGKTTTTQMIAYILKAEGKKVLLGGNIQGVSTLALLSDVTPDATAVLELDSWQLQGFREEKLSPNIAVFTTFYPDHQDYYQGMDAYLKDKAAIFEFQKEGDTLIVGTQALDAVQKVHAVHPVIAQADDIDFTLSIPGEHNRYNAACALKAAEALGIDAESAKGALSTFSGVAGRLERVREVNGVTFYNDTTATTPEATLAALRALGRQKNIVLIMGGYDKGLDMGELLVEIPKCTKRVILLAGTGTNRVLEFIPGASVFDSLDAAFTEAVHAAGSDDIVLLSPAFASFGMFANEYQRGDAFTTLVGELA